jgi:EAL domain-containing protein (putative c-di-GMP-specific phosphodiesterase class I)
LVLIEDLQDARDGGIVAEKILKCLSEPFSIEGHAITISVSIGISIFPDDGTDANILLKNADAAMYRAKREGRNSFEFYTPELTARAAEHVFMENALRLALNKKEFFLVYQPQISLHDGSVSGVEALIRWHHSEQGVIPPSRFIPIAEQLSLMKGIGAWVLGEACKQARHWLDHGVRFGRVAVNLAGSQILQADFLDNVNRALSEAGLSGAYLELEITETFIMDRPDETIERLKELQSQQIKIAIDDFGTGYSSMSYLEKLPIDKLKIDQSFVGGLPEDGDDIAIVDAILALARALKLEVIAEGAENEAQVNLLKEKNCDEIQGYYFSRPLEEPEVTAYLKTHRSWHE